jgi:hypothetical protein
VTPWIADTIVNTRERPGYEIDARAHRLENTVQAGVDVVISGKTRVGASARRTRFDFDADEVFRGSRLNEVLNRRVTAVEASVRYSVTPVTILVLQAETARERFDLTPQRDADSIRILPGVEFDALITGRASVGYRRMEFRTAAVPAYSGVVAETDIAYTVLGATRVSLGVKRDVAFSFDVAEPYYLQTGTTVAVTQQLATAWDVVGRVGTHRLAYARAQLSARNRVDHVRTLGGGIGYRLGDGLRFGVNVDFYRRDSEVARRDYRGLLVGSSVTYGF